MNMLIKNKDEEKYYVFLDEVQNVPEFQKAVDGLYIKKNVDLYIQVQMLIYYLENLQHYYLEDI